MAGAGGGRVRAIVIATLVVGIAFAAVWAVTGTIPFMVAFRGYERVHEDLSRLTGFSGYVINAVAAIAAAALLVLYRAQRLRRTSIVALVAFSFVLFAVYQMGLFSVTRETNFANDGEGARCYAVTQRGVIYSDRIDCDGQTEPVSGSKFAKMRPELVAGLQQLERAARAREFRPVDPDAQDWFHPLTKEPLLYYSRAESGELEFFDAPGYHPGTSQALLAVTHELRLEYEARKRAVVEEQERRIQAEQAARREAEEQSRAREQALARAAQEKAAAEARARERREREAALRDADPASRRAPASGEIYSY